MDATLFSNRVEFTELGNAITLAGSDIIRGEVVRIPAPNAPGNEVTFVRLYLCGDAKLAYGDYYDVDFRNLANQPTWTDRVDTIGAFTCLEDLAPIFRRPISTGGGGQVDTIVPGDAIDVDSTDPVNPIVNVLVDGVTIGFNGSNELETIGGAGDVVGPVSSTDDHVVLFDGATGKLIKDSGYTPGGLVIPTGFGDIDLIETSPGYWPVEIKGGLDGDGTTMQANTGSFQVNVNPKNSIEIDAAQVQLVGDEAAPGNSEYYGTNGAGTKGFHPLPTDTGITELTGDVTAGPGSGSQAATLASVIAAGGPTGSATVAPIITYDAKGRLTAVSSATITPAASSITSPQALTKVDDTNVTLTLGGTPSTALLQAASITAGWTGQLSIARGGTGQSTQTAAFDALAPTTTKGDLIVHDGTDNIRVAVGSDGMVPFADSGATSGVEWRYPVTEVELFTLATTLTNQPNSLEILTTASPGIFITRFDLTNYTEVMLQIHVFVASGSANSPRIILGYANSYTLTPGSYSDIGTSAVTCSMSATGIIRSSWIPIAAGALGDVFISALSNGGNGTADPQIQGVRMFVR